MTLRLLAIWMDNQVQWLKMLVPRLLVMLLLRLRMPEIWRLLILRLLAIWMDNQVQWLKMLVPRLSVMLLLRLRVKVAWAPKDSQWVNTLTIKDRRTVLLRAIWPAMVVWALLETL
jgi:hypothetical protein